jgi:outer membrane receptor protein involved in Fe transport
MPPVLYISGVKVISALLTCAVLGSVPAAAGAQGTSTSGVVKDESGGVISGAAVMVTGPSGVVLQTVTGPEGRFTFDRPLPTTGELVVRAVGFAELKRPLGDRADIEVVLAAAAVTEAVTVTPTRTEQRLGDVPASVSVVSRDTIRRSPALVADDVLRLVPTFSLFRRTSSLASHPTAQGVSLRGIGPSGVSRSLVLLDGVPFNDPFGGWVYWTRVPLDSVERIEIVDGTSANVYGNYALGGVINVVSSRPKPRTVELRTQFGNKSTRKGDFFASDVWGRLGASVDGSFFDTTGFPIVVEEERGPIDTKASAEYHNLNLKVDYRATDQLNVSFRGGYFREDRNNAKYSTFDFAPEENSTVWRAFSAGMRWILPDQSDLQARLFTDHETFQSSFLAVPNLVTRAIGRTSLRQRVPTDGVGWIAHWSKPISTRQLVTIGVDGRHVDGASQERAFDTVSGQTVTLVRESGGTQMMTGGYVQTQLWPAPRLAVTLSGRVDRWRNYDARNLETTVATGLPTATSGLLPDKEDTVFSPRAAVLYHVNSKVTAWGSLGSGFRAPTLNELYRQFRVGAILTLANEELGPERLLGAEIGLNVAPVENLTIRTTWFDNRVKEPVSNVTRPDLGANTRKRQNLGRTHVWGAQTDVEYRLTQQWQVGGGYMFNQARVTEFDASPDVVGRYLPQVPRHRGSISVTYSDPRLATVSVSGLFFGRQYEDDLNILARPGEPETGLPAYGVAEFMVTRALGRHADAFFGVQNLFDQQYYVGLLPTTIGSPRLVNGGIRVKFSGR